MCVKQAGPEVKPFVCNTELMFMLLIKSALKVHSKGLSELGLTLEQPVCCELVLRQHSTSVAT
jgi:hypothetical protein